MGEAKADGPPQDGAGGKTARRPQVKALIGFLAVFLLLIILFRGVLFPFLLAMFIAYLIEPLVERITRSRLLGIRWTRGPTIVVLYVLALGGLVLLSSCAVASVAQNVKVLTVEIAGALESSAERARFLVVDPETGDVARPSTAVRIPAGTRVVLRPARTKTGTRAEPEEPLPAEVFATHYDVVIEPEESLATVLLDRTESEDAPEYAPETIVDLEGIRSTDDRLVVDVERLIRVSTAEPAAGLEVFLERKLITPALENLKGAGFEVEPTQLRSILAAQAAHVSEDLPQKITRFGRSLVGKVALSIYQFILILMLTAFLVMDRKRISTFFASLPPPALKEEYHSLMRYIDDGLSGVIRGQLVVCMVNGVLTYVGLTALSVKAAGLLSVIAAILSLIPIFGTIVSTIPIVLVALTDGFDKGLMALGWIMLIHLLEANLFNPMIMGSHARMHPVIIIFALLAGEHAFGVWGALLAVPAASILQSCFLYYRHEIEGIPRPPRVPPGKGLPGLLARLRGRRAEAAS